MTYTDAITTQSSTFNIDNSHETWTLAAGQTITSSSVGIFEEPARVLAQARDPGERVLGPGQGPFTIFRRRQLVGADETQVAVGDAERRPHVVYQYSEHSFRVGHAGRLARRLRHVRHNTQTCQTV